KMPFEIMDRIWDGWEKGVSSDEIASVLNLSKTQVDVMINDLRQKIQTTEYLRQEPLSLG
ncbi:MAG TPA: NAD(+) synthase, partial [Ignavibacteriaceae bacterium]|nr:NAD(+) synthase [Ignavibacteriaceae bacterium]